MADNIPPYYPTLAEQLSGKCIHPHVVIRDQIEQISQNLREQISKSIKDMKVLSNERSYGSNPPQLVVPLSSIPPRELNAQLDETPKKKGKHATTKVVGQFSISYEVPPICYQNNIDLDNLHLYGESSSSDNNKDHQFSFTQRLQS
ncbi:hypothetical protein QN277_023539 [Acacia crassicarpa]|uniref:Uncharacterized protein n=1 Tax=Acacia crassicarpa TaxID=499986 RepID=A0AAE1JHD6_9FABA|nr:hypothetical protein QN277_023539 [Acacia crassicarpa]